MIEQGLREIMVSLPPGTLRQPQLFHGAIYRVFARQGEPRDFLFKGLELAEDVAVVRARRFGEDMADMARPITYAADRDIYDFHLTAAPQYRDHATQKLRFLPVEDDRFGRHLAWLRRKAAEAGFTTSGDVAIERRIVSIPQKGHMAIDHCEFSGTLRVIDRPRFEAALEHGIGPRAGYGYGLLSLY